MLHEPIKPMLLHPTEEIPHGDNWIHQLKFDGFRCILSYKNGDIRLFTRHQNDCTIQFPEIHPHLNGHEIILDGEMIVLDEQGKPCFESVMKRLQTTKQSSIQYLSTSLPAHFVAFDILYHSKPLISLPLKDRLQILDSIVIPSNSISVCPTFINGKELFHSTEELGLEGIVSKRLDSKYSLNVRSHNWLKKKAYLYDIVTIHALRKGEFGWSISKDGEYVGVMEFVPQNERKALYQVAKQIVTKETDKWIYIEPVFKCKVKFQAYTKSGLMRSPTFVEFILN